jgi:hypothetical protein
LNSRLLLGRQPRFPYATPAYLPLNPFPNPLLRVLWARTGMNPRPLRFSKKLVGAEGNAPSSRRFQRRANLSQLNPSEISTDGGDRTRALPVESRMCVPLHHARTHSNAQNAPCALDEIGTPSGARTRFVTLKASWPNP